jgi:hypothetical protein
MEQSPLSQQKPHEAAKGLKFERIFEDCFIKEQDCGSIGETVHILMGIVPEYESFEVVYISTLYHPLLLLIFRYQLPLYHIHQRRFQRRIGNQVFLLDSVERKE